MRFHALTLMLLAAACGGSQVTPLDQKDKTDELAYDETTANLKARGKLLGEPIDIREVLELEAIREYEAPALPGTEDPDLTRARLVSVEVKGIVMRDGEPWEVQLDIEGDDLGAFSTGELIPEDSIEIAFQLQNEDESVELEDIAMAGAIDIKRYDDEGKLDPSSDVLVGGSIGAVFDIELSNGDRLTGALFSGFTETEVDTP